jgi:protein-disulfide isomerase
MRQYLVAVIAAVAASALTALAIVPTLVPAAPVPPVRPAADDGQRAAFGAQVRTYLLENPEVLMEAIRVLETRQAEMQAVAEQAAVTNNADEILNDGYSWVGGNPEGDVTLVEFMDYRCGYCRKAHEDLKTLVETDGNIRFVVKEFPILGEDSLTSSRLAIAVLHKAGPDAYRAVGETLIAYSGPLNEQTMSGILSREGLDPALILPYMTDPAVTGQIGAVHALAGSLDISGTPTFVIGTELVRGYAPLDVMRQIVAQHREARAE